jgi:hypothetical protein
VDREPLVCHEPLVDRTGLLAFDDEPLVVHIEPWVVSDETWVGRIVA